MRPDVEIAAENHVAFDTAAAVDANIVAVNDAGGLGPDAPAVQRPRPFAINDVAMELPPHGRWPWRDWLRKKWQQHPWYPPQANFVDERV